MINIEKSTLDKLSIHELRDLARQVGVHLPTTFKREDLCNEIMAIVLGEKEPYTRKTKQGRPPKISRKLNDVAELLLPNELDKEYVSSVFSSPEFVFNANRVIYQNDEEIPFSGHFVGYDSYGIVVNNNMQKIYVTITLINKYNLVSGDFLEGTYRTISDDRKLVQTLNTINKIDADSYKNVMPNKILANNCLKILDNEILIGGTNLIWNNTFDLNTLAQSFSKDYLVVVLNINVKDENFQTINDNIYTFNINYKLQDKDIYELSVAGINDAKRKAEMSKSKVVLIVNSLTELIKINNSCLTNDITINEIKSNVIKNTKILMSSSFNAEDRSFTIIDVENTNIQHSLSDILNFELNNFFDRINKA